MQSEQHPSAPPQISPLDIQLAVDVDVGWRLGLKTVPGQVPPPDAYPLSEEEDVNAVFEAEYVALLRDPLGVAELKEAVSQAILNRLSELRSEFFIQEFAYSLFRVGVCWDCVNKVDCLKCDKTGFVTEVFTPYLVGFCSLKAVHHGRSERLGTAVSGVAPESLPQPKRPSQKRWLMLTVPVAALATVVMAASIGLRFMLQSGDQGYQPPAFPPQVIRSTVAPTAIPPAPPTESRPESQPEPPLPPASPTPTPPVSVKLAPVEASEVTLVEPRRKPIPTEPSVTPGPPPSPPATPAPPAGGDKNWPMIRLQTALTQLNFYHGPVNGVLDEGTRHALGEFLAAVPPAVRTKYGTQTAAMAEAATRHEFTLKGR